MDHQASELNLRKDSWTNRIVQLVCESDQEKEWFVHESDLNLTARSSNNDFHFSEIERKANVQI